MTPERRKIGARPSNRIVARDYLIDYININLFAMGAQK